MPYYDAGQVDRMKQKRICEYFGLPCTHFLTFLDFPVAVRRFIYKLAGLAVGTTISLVPGRGADAAVFLPAEDSFCLTLRLLQTCKAVYDDVMTIILSQNSFVVPPTGLDYGLWFLRRLAPQYCYCIADLHVHLHQESVDESSLGKKKTSLLKTGQVVAWQETALYVLTHTKPRTLNLHLICDATGTSDHTSAVIHPLLASPGKLADCELRLGAKRDSRISALALETACRVTGNYTDPALRKETFRFLDLSQELRRSILEYTDLVTPYRQVQWNPQTGFYCIFLLHYCDDEYCQRELHHGCQFLFCGRGVSRDFARLDRSQSLCRAKYSSYSSSCRCWIAPGYLMLVSRAIYHDAKAVFYSRNHVIVNPSKDIHLTGARASSMRLGTSRFITRYMWPDVLWHISTLELVFPPFETIHYYDTDDPTYLDWLFSIDHLAAHANVSNLTLIIHMSTTSHTTYSDQSKLLWHMRTIANANDASPPLPYARLLMPLRALCRMKRFFVHLEAPWHYAPRGSDYTSSPLYGGVDVEARHRAHRMEIQLEKLVMGDAYDSYTAGKGDEEPSHWLTWIWNAIA